MRVDDMLLGLVPGCAATESGYARAQDAATRFYSYEAITIHTRPS